MNYSMESTARRLKKDARVRRKITNTISILIFRALFAVVLIGGFAAVFAGLGLYFSIIKESPEVSVEILPQIFTSIIYDSKTGAELAQLTGDQNRVYATIKEMPKNLTNAFVAIEDERFYLHDGVDFRGVVRAAVTAIQTMGKRTEGASTITQQLIKNNVNKRNSNTLPSKLQEQFMAMEYEKVLSDKDHLGSKQAAKDYILEVYVNSINLGRNYYGVQTAAKMYFNKDVSELTLSECAVIAAITQNPTKYVPDSKPANNRERQKLVLKKMLELNFVTQAEYDEAYNDDVYSRIVRGANGETVSTIYSYYEDALISQVSKDLQDKYQLTPAQASDWIFNRGLQIYSAQDHAMQATMDEVIMDDSYYPASLFAIDLQYVANVKRKVSGKIDSVTRKETVKSVEEADAFVEEWKEDILNPGDVITYDHVFKIPQPQVAMCIIDYHTGIVKAITGGRGEKTVNRSLNRATDSARQPGSVFKVLASYAPAIDMGKITPSTLIVDEPYKIGEWEFHNWWGNYYKGPQTVRRAITESMNICAVRNLVETTGIENAFDYLLRFGFTTLVYGETRADGRYYTDRQAAMALGGLTDGVTVLEVTEAYGAIANDGEYLKPYFYTKVLDHDGRILLENETIPRRVLNSGAAYMLTDMMQDVIRGQGGTGGQARFVNSGMPISGKTGTTTETKDLEFVAYTPYYVAGIWTGFDMPKPMDFRQGESNYHLRLWRAVMEKIHEDLPIKKFDVPENAVTYATICKDSGLLATDFCHQDPRGDRTSSEMFNLSELPTEYCDTHVIITIDTSTGMKANADCPPESLQTRVGVLTWDIVEDETWQIPYALYSGPECYYHGPEARPFENRDPNTGDPRVDEPIVVTTDDNGPGEGTILPVTESPIDNGTPRDQTPQPTPVPTYNAVPVPPGAADPPPMSQGQDLFPQDPRLDYPILE